MLEIIIRSGSTEEIKQAFCKMIKNENIISVNCRFNTKTLENSLFEFKCEDGKKSILLDRMALGYGGAGPSDFLYCLRKAGFDRTLVPESWVYTDVKMLDDGEIIAFSAHK